MAESRYNLRRTLHPTPKSKVNQTALARRKNRKRTASLSPSPTPPLPPPPNFGITTSAPESFDMDTGEGSSGQFNDHLASDAGYETLEQVPDTDDNGVDQAAAEVDYWLGAGASQEIASMCVDAELSPDEDLSPSSVEEHLRASVVPSSVDEELDSQDHRTSLHVEPVDTAMAPPLHNPFPPLNPFPQFIFPDSMPQNDTIQTDAGKDAFFQAHEFGPHRVEALSVDRAPSSVLPAEMAKEVPGPSALPEATAKDALPNHTAKDAYLKALGFGPPGASSFDVPSSALPKDTAKDALPNRIAKDDYLKALGFGPPGASSFDVPSSALPKDTAKEAHLKALGFGPPGASLGGFEVEAHITHQKTALSPAKVDYDAPAEDEDSFLFPNSDDSPLADDFTKDIDESREPVPRQQAGRISSPTWNVLNAGFQKIDDTIDDLAIKTGRTRENVISLWKRTQAHECSGSMWNKYQKYFLANREKERRRIGDLRANCKYFFYLNMFSADSDD